MTIANPRATARFLGAFFDELSRWGVRDVVVSPGSRSTPLSMVAYELARRTPRRMRLFVDVDERGAAFLALGMAKASGRPVAVVCTSGSAVANYYPAVMEAESSRVPLVVLTGDRPPQLQGLGAPQTCDQSHAYGSHVRAFRAMPLPADDEPSLAFARQAAREACICALGAGAEAFAGAGVPTDGQLDAETVYIDCDDQGFSANGKTPARIAGACFGGPVHLNFPFDEPLKPEVELDDLFDGGRLPLPNEVVGTARATGALDAAARGRLSELLTRGAVLLAGEGSCATPAEARDVLRFAHAHALPVLADPLSGLRCFDDPCVIANYDSVLDTGGVAPDDLLNPQVIVRFGRYPISKKATQWAACCARAGAVQVVVDPYETRDTNAATSLFVRMMPVDFARAMAACAAGEEGTSPEQAALLARWRDADAAACARIESVGSAPAADSFEGAYVRRVLQLAPEGSCLFSAASMSVRAIDTFMTRQDRRLCMLSNRGLNGIDGTVSTAIGAAQHFRRTTLLAGDLTLLHDLNALALQRELHVQAAVEADTTSTSGSSPAPVRGITIVLLNNNGGAIFDMLPQKSADSYFERLFLTPQDVDFAAAAATFGVPYAKTTSLEAFDQAYRASLDVAGISLIEVPVPLSGVKERYGTYW